MPFLKMRVVFTVIRAELCSRVSDTKSLFYVLDMGIENRVYLQTSTPITQPRPNPFCSVTLIIAVLFSSLWRIRYVF